MDRTNFILTVVSIAVGIFLLGYVAGDITRGKILRNRIDGYEWHVSSLCVDTAFYRGELRCCDSINRMLRKENERFFNYLNYKIDSVLRKNRVKGDWEKSIDVYVKD
jgi:hypothetical protein